MIRLQNLVLGYGGNAVIRDVNLELAAGDFLVIGGPNGGGKSTLLRGISGLISPIAGTIDRGRTRFGYVPQHANVEQALPLTALEMVELGASACDPWWKTVITPRAAFHHQAMRDCQADGFAKKPFDALSGGQRQRVLLARALASSPDCLLLDEPTAGVDRPTQFALAEMLGDLHRKSGLAIVLVTHEFAPFKDVAKRFVWVQDGALRELTAGDFHGRQENPTL
ncbi:MAG: ATP-binding cassette domain-containing protein [Luteolibacter sp.]|uniref:metal ABC transporter ATP-binding protein n=1 Tax=Luteolibacter sp. TaxID=1962973 RepID=UPI00326675D2